MSTTDCLESSARLYIHARRAGNRRQTGQWKEKKKEKKKETEQGKRKTEETKKHTLRACATPLRSLRLVWRITTECDGERQRQRQRVAEAHIVT